MEEMQNLNINMSGFELPFCVEKDNEYYETLKILFSKYSKFIKNHQVPAVANMYRKVRKTVSRINKALDLYYAGAIADSLKCIKSILNDIVSAGNDVRLIEKCYAFKGASIEPPKSCKEEYSCWYKYAAGFSPLIFYRARIGTEKYDIKDMLHIPFDNRGIIQNKRFSINGLPCLYLASTTYGSWLEMGKPANDEFQVCAYILPKDLQILDLTIRQDLINGLSSMATNKEIKQALDYVEMFPLVIAISGVVKEKGRTFKSEYIIPQLLMLACKEKKINGIAYLSTQSSDSFSYPQAVNLAIMMSKGKSDKYWNRLNDVRITNPVCFAEFLMRPKENESKENVKAFVNALFHDDFSNTIKLADRPSTYTQTSFSGFDEYLAGCDFQNAAESK